MNSVHVDGAIYVLIAFFGAIAAALGSDDAAKYIQPASLWYAKNICTAIAASLLALKMFRSTGFAALQDQKNGVEKVKTGHTDFIVKETNGKNPIAKVVEVKPIVASTAS